MSRISSDGKGVGEEKWKEVGSEPEQCGSCGREAHSDRDSEQMNLGPRAGERQEESEEAVVNIGAGGPHYHADDGGPQKGEIRNAE